MDPLSLTASILAVVTAAGAVAKGLAKLRNLKDAPAELLGLVNEFSDLQIVLDEVDEVIRAQARPGQNRRSLRLAQLLLRAKDTLLNLNSLIQGPLTQARKVDGGGEHRVARIVWMRERTNVKKLHDEIREIRMNITTALASSNAIEISRVGLRINEVSFTTMELRDRQTQQHEQTSLQLFQQAEMLREVCQALGNGSVSSGEGSFPISSESLLEARRKPIIENNLDSLAWRPIPYLQSVQFRASRAAGTKCKTFCSCVCHARRQIKVPRALSMVIGSLFIGYTGFPSLVAACNERACLRRTKSVAQFTYVFPAWLFMRGVVAKVAPTPELLLRAVRVIPSRSAIFHHAMLGDVDKIHELFSQRLASPFDIAPSGSSFALNSSRFAVCKALLDSSADPFYEGQNDSKPIDIAWDRILGGFESNSTQETLVSLFNATDYLESRQFSIVHKIVLEILNLDLDTTLQGSTTEIDRLDSSRRSPLLWAALRADTEAVRTLIHHGANVHSCDSSGKNALHYARNVSVTKLILAANPPIDGRDIYGRTALHAACRRSPDLQRIEMLVDAGAEVDAIDNWNRTSLSYASQFNYRQVAEYLLSKGASTESSDVDGFTPLLTAIESNSHDLIQLLLNREIDLGKLDRYPESLLQSATRSGDVKTLKMLADFRLRAPKQDQNSIESVSPRVITPFGGLVAGSLYLSKDLSNRAKISSGQEIGHAIASTAHKFSWIGLPVTMACAMAFRSSKDERQPSDVRSSSSLSPQDAKYILVYVSNGKLCHPLQDFDISAARTDRELFKAIRTVYEMIHRSPKIRWIPKFGMPKSIRLIQFSIRGTVNDRPVTLCQTQQMSDRETKVPKSWYLHNYRKHDVDKSISSSAFLHHLSSPTCASNGTTYLDQLPKRYDVSLARTLQNEESITTEFWAIEIVDGVDLFSILFCITSIISICIFLWALRSHMVALNS